jgi:hypothetical protein
VVLSFGITFRVQNIKKGPFTKKDSNAKFIYYNKGFAKSSRVFTKSSRLKPHGVSMHRCSERLAICMQFIILSHRAHIVRNFLDLT